jgi:hypothetical protein
MNGLDLDAIEAEFLKQCPSCDFGLPAGCACSDRDHRPAMSDVVARVRELEGVVERVKKAAQDWEDDDDAYLVKHGQHLPGSVARMAELLRAALEGDRA